MYQHEYFLVQDGAERLSENEEKKKGKSRVSFHGNLKDFRGTYVQMKAFNCKASSVINGNQNMFE